MTVRPAVALRLVGFARCDEPAAALAELFGAAEEAGRCALAPGEWRLLDPLAQGEPVGPPRSVVELRAVEAARYELVPGSQGASAPPGPNRAVTLAELPAGAVLLVDARLWLRAGAPGVQATLWRPRAVGL